MTQREPQRGPEDPTPEDPKPEESVPARPTRSARPAGSRRARLRRRSREVSTRSIRAARRHVRGILAVRPAVRRWPVALKAAVAVVLPLSVATALGHQEWAMTCSLGTFGVLFGARTAGRFRARLYTVIGLGFVGAATVGALSAGLPFLHMLAMVVVSTLGVLLSVALKIGPPGAVFFPLVVGVAGFVVANGIPPEQLVLSVAVGALTAWVVGMSDLVVRPRGPEEAAVRAATEAVERYEEVPAEAGVEEFGLSRAGASTAMHVAWTTVTDSVGRRGSLKGRLDLVQRLRDLHHRYAMRTAFSAHIGSDAVVAHPWDDQHRDAEPEALRADREDGTELAEPPARVGATPSPRIDFERLRQTSLGRPSGRFLLRDALHWPSETLVITVRIAVAATVTALLALVLGPGHAYWAVFSAVLVLHQGGTLAAQTYRGLQRLVGTSVGVLVFAAVVLLDPRGWWLVLVLGLLQFGVEMLVVRNYGAASVLITPLALTIGYVGAGRIGAEGVVLDRLVDTLLGVAVALVTLWCVGRRSPLLVFRGQGRRCILAMESVMSDVATSLPDTPEARERRRHLYFELLEYEAVGDRALSDDRAAVTPYLPMRREIVELGYFVLGAAWHPTLRFDTERFARARRGFAPILAAPVTRPRAAADIEADVRGVHQLITDWDGLEDWDEGETGPGESNGAGEER